MNLNTKFNIDLDYITPVEKINGIYLKREDYFKFAGCNGSKVRSALYLILNAYYRGHTTFVSIGSRFSPQCEIISNICEALNLKCYLFMPNSNEDTTVLKNIHNNKNTTLIRELKQGAYTNVLVSRAKKFAELNGYYYIPFGMDCFENVCLTEKQVENLPNDIKRIVVAVGSGVNFCAIANGLIKNNKTNIELIGICVGKDPSKVINKYILFPNLLKYKLIMSQVPYEKAINLNFNNVELDPIYEAKCVQYLQPGDLFWIVGHRKFD